ncbi:hypothetical protein MGG_13309 [Pyricularia oryzae 70-15]|uniref:DUF6590 domain-containing protein n=2 Tax=Pyricularia oryzae TaxID=318829 RepID=G4N0H6_PYRO7|nr:uncharacterized protein MGG_13309 [Pyricularia oryzae 70-15]EHA52310.1 hypothetical protein MGG_13309 [Pyricularia oryzae 70-15]
MSEESNRSIEDQQPTVSGAVALCLEEFKLCLDTAAALGPEELSLIEDQLARFSVWTANMAVFVPGRASMDHCLRQAPEVLDIVIGVLDALRSCIDTNRRTIEAMLRDLADKSETSASANSQGLTKPLAALAQEITLLYQLSNPIRKASKDSQNLKAAEDHQIKDDEGNDVGPLLQQIFARFIADRFPKITDGLAERLSSAMLLRRKRILYRRSHYGTSPIRVKKVALRPEVPFPSVMKLEGQPLDKMEHQGASIVPSTIPAQSATTSAPENYEKASTSSIISISNSDFVGTLENLAFPSAPTDSIRKVYAKLKEQRKREHETRLMSVPGYALYQKHQGEPPLSDSEISELKRKISEAEETLRANLKEDWKKSTAAVAEFICPFCLHVLPGLYLTDQRKWNERNLQVLVDRAAAVTGPTIFKECPFGDVHHDDTSLDEHIEVHLNSIALKSLPLYHEDGGYGSDGEDKGTLGASGQGSRSTIHDDPEMGSTLAFDSQDGFHSDPWENGDSELQTAKHTFSGVVSHFHPLHKDSRTAGERLLSGPLGLIVDGRSRWHPDPSFLRQASNYQTVEPNTRRDFLWESRGDQWGFVGRLDYNSELDRVIQQNRHRQLWDSFSSQTFTTKSVLQGFSADPPARTAGSTDEATAEYHSLPNKQSMSASLGGSSPAPTRSSDHAKLYEEDDASRFDTNRSLGDQAVKPHGGPFDSDEDIYESSHPSRSKGKLKAIVEEGDEGEKHIHESDETDPHASQVWAEERGCDIQLENEDAKGLVTTSAFGELSDHATNHSTYPYMEADALHKAPKGPRISAARQPRITDARFQRYESSDFRPGAVFETFWAEPMAALSQYTTAFQAGKSAQVSTHRFIIVGNLDNHSYCVPIVTYGRQGCKKKGVKPHRHGIAYSGQVPPQMLENEPELGHHPARVYLKPDIPDLLPESRVDYSTLCTVLHNVEVLFIGFVLMDDFLNVVQPATYCCMVESVNERQAEDPMTAQKK